MQGEARTAPHPQSARILASCMQGPFSGLSNAVGGTHRTDVPFSSPPSRCSPSQPPAGTLSTPKPSGVIAPSPASLPRSGALAHAHSARRLLVAQGAHATWHFQSVPQTPRGGQGLHLGSGIKDARLLARQKCTSLQGGRT